MNLTRLSFAVMFLLVLSMPAQLNYNFNSSSAQVQNDTISQNYTQPAPVHVSQPLVPAAGTTTRSFSSTAGLHGNSDTVTQRISWYQNGTVALDDTMGNSLDIDIPVPGGTLSILQNDTTIDQRFAGTGLQYDIYWKAVAGPDGSIEKYKITIAGTSTNGFAMKIPLRTIQHLVQDGNRFLAVPVSTLDNSTALQGGIGLDWSDAVSSGYAVSLGANNTITLNLGKSFSVDPTTVDTVTVRISPQSSDYYEGEKRVLKVGITTFAFYYDNSNIVYQYSTDGGNSWGGKISAGTGTVASDTYRWTVASATINGTSYIDLLYYQVSGSNTNFYSKTGTVTGTNISWGAAKQIFQKASTDPKAAAVAATDTKNEIFAAFRYYTGTAFLHQVWKSADAGNTWTNTTITASSNSGYRTVMTLAPLASGKMLFAYTSYDHTEFNYTVYGGSSWGAAQTTSGSGLATNTFKEISSDSNSTQPYLAYVIGGNSSSLVVARWNSDGTFNKFEPTQNNMTNSLPSVTVTPDGTVHVYTISGGKVYDTRKIGSTWKAPSNPFGITFTAPNHLSSGISYAGALWEETASPFNVRFGSLTDSAQFVASTSSTLSPPVTDYYEGEKRVVSVNGTTFAFYFDGSNIVYNYTTDNGASWSSSASANAGAIASDSYRWTVAATNHTGTNYVMLLYYQVSGTNTNFYSKTGNVTGTSITWGAAHTIFQRSTTDPKAAAVAAADTNGNIFAAFRYYTGSAFLHQIWKWSVSGHTWANTTSTTTANSGYRTVMTLAPLASGKMLFAYASYDHTDFTYQVYNGTSWGSAASTTNAKMTTNTFKQISSDSDDNHAAYLAYVLGGNSSSLVVARWNSDGTFNKFEATQNNMTNSLPSITFTPDGIIHVYTISGGKVWETDKVNSYWAAAKNPFGTTFTSPNDLTSAISSATSLWAENSASPYNVMFGTNRIGWTANTGILEPLYVDPYNSTNPSTCQQAHCFAWDPINATKIRYPHVPFFVIVNPGSDRFPNGGPGSPPPGSTDCAFEAGYTGNRTKDYQRAISTLASQGVVVLGYVYSSPSQASTTARSQQLVEGNVTAWTQCYPGIKGIFLDVMPNFDTDGFQSYYSGITSFIHNNSGLAYSYGNPGADLLSTYQGTVDLLDIYESYAGDTNPSDAQLTNSTLQGCGNSGTGGVPGNPCDWHTLHDKSTYSFLRFNQTGITQHSVQNETVYVGFLYFTENTGCGPHHPASYCAPDNNPWNTTATYLTTMASYLNNLSVLSTIQAIDKSSGNSIHITKMTIFQSNHLVRNATTPFTYNETAGWPFNFTAPAINSTSHFCYWTYPGTNTTNKSILVSPTMSSTYTATFSPTC